MRITAVLGVLLAVGGAGYWFWSKRKPVVPVRRAPLPTYAPMVTYQLPPGQTIPGPMVPAQSVNPFLPGYVAPAPTVNPFLAPTAAPAQADVFFAWRPGTPPVRQAQIQQQFNLTPAPAEFGNLLSFRAPAPQGTSALYAALQAVPELQQMGVMEAAQV
jgi:hypothetical protein